MQPDNPYRRALEMSAPDAADADPPLSRTERWLVVAFTFTAVVLAVGAVALLVAIFA